MPIIRKKLVFIKLTSSGSDTNNFNIYERVYLIGFGTSSSLIGSGISKSSLSSGLTFSFNLGSTGYLIESTGPCTSTLETVFTSTTTTTTTLAPSYYIWSVNLTNSTPSMPSFCNTGNQFTMNVYTQYSSMNIGTTIYYDSALTTIVNNKIWMRPITISSPGLSDNTIYEIENGVITSLTYPGSC